MLMQIRSIPSSILKYLQIDKCPILERIILLCIPLYAFSIILSIAIAQIFAWVIILVFIINQIGKRKWIKTSLDVPLLVFILIRFLSIIFSIDPYASARALHTELPYYFIFFAITQQQANISEKYLRLVIWTLITSAVIGSAYGIFIVLSGIQERAVSLTSGYYTLGSFLSLILISTVILGKSSMFKTKRLLWFGIVIMMSICIILTKNRIHWGVMTLGLLLVGLIRERKLLFLVLAIGVGIVFYSPSVLKRFNQTIHFQENLSGRNILWKGASLIWSDHPLLGYGPNTFVKIFPIPNELEDKGAAGWHNDYLQIFIESGLLGLLGMAWLISAYYYSMIKFLRISRNNQKELILALICGITTILLSSLTGSAFLDILIRMLFCLIIGISVNLIQKQEKESGISTNNKALSD